MSFFCAIETVIIIISPNSEILSYLYLVNETALSPVKWPQVTLNITKWQLFHTFKSSLECKLKEDIKKEFSRRGKIFKRRLEGKTVNNPQGTCFRNCGGGGVEEVGRGEGGGGGGGVVDKLMHTYKKVVL